MDFFSSCLSVSLYIQMYKRSVFFIVKGHISYLYIFFSSKQKKDSIWDWVYKFSAKLLSSIVCTSPCFAYYRYLTPYLLYINFQCNILWLDLKTRTLYITWYLCFVIFPSTQRQRIFYGSSKVFYECKILELNWVDSEET